MREEKFEDLKGMTLTKIEGNEGDDVMIFTTDTGDKYQLYHSQDCCESVTIEDINGNITDLIGSPLVQAEESTNCEDNPDDVKPEYQDSFTWTFYKLATIKGHVVIRWYGESNGYYSEAVDFMKVV